MTLILLLLVLVTERVALQGTRWQVDTYLNWYLGRYQSKLNDKENEPLAILLFVALPALLVGIVMYFIDLGLINFLINLFVLAVAIGNPMARSYYRQYLNAESRGDTEAMALLQQKFSALTPKPNKTPSAESANATVEQVEEAATTENQEEPIVETQRDGPRVLSESLIWCNFKYYAVPIFYFVLFGAPGVLFYTAVIYLLDSPKFTNDSPKPVVQTLNQWAEWLYWLPARFVSIGFMFVGNFSQGLEAYLRLAANFTVSGFDIISQVAHAADDIKLVAEDEISETTNKNAKKIVKLAKRNMALFIVVVALLTLYGYIV